MPWSSGSSQPHVIGFCKAVHHEHNSRAITLCLDSDVTVYGPDILQAQAGKCNTEDTQTMPSIYG